MFPKFVDKLQKSIKKIKKKKGKKVHIEMCHQRVFDVHPIRILITARIL